MYQFTDLEIIVFNIIKTAKCHLYTEQIVEKIPNVSPQKVRSALTNLLEKGVVTQYEDGTWKVLNN